MTDHGPSFNVAADAYDRHVGRYSRELARELIAFAGLAAADRCLDVGCGPGGLAGELIEVVGVDRVVAVDPSTNFVAACQSRFPTLRVEQASAADLPFEDGWFDAVLSQLVINFLPDAPAGLEEMTRVTRADGLIAAAVWDYRAGMTLLRTFWDAAVAIEPAAQASDEASSMRYCSPPELIELWTLAGLGDVRTASATIRAEYAGFDDLWLPFEQGVGPAGAYAVARPHEERDALRAELQRRLGVADEPFALDARAFLVSGRVRR